MTEAAAELRVRDLPKCKTGDLVLVSMTYDEQGEYVSATPMLCRIKWGPDEKGLYVAEVAIEVGLPWQVKFPQGTQRPMTRDERNEFNRLMNGDPEPLYTSDVRSGAGYVLKNPPNAPAYVDSH